MSNLATPAISQPPVGLSVRLMKLLVAALPWLIIVALLLAGIFIRPQPVGTTLVPPALEGRDQFYGLAQLADQSLLAVGSGGKILRLQQQQISRLDSPVRSSLQDIAVWPSGELVAVGNDAVVLYSADGGAHWQQAANVPRSEIANKLNRVRVGANGLAVAVGEMGALLLSRDYGHSWQRLREEEDVAWNDVALLDDGQVLVVGEFGRMLRGNLAGQDWQEIDTGLGASLMAVTFHDAQHGVAVGLEGLVLSSSDAGQSWQTLDVGLREHLFDVAWQAEQQQWFVSGALGRWATGQGNNWQQGTLDARNLSWHVRVLPVAGGLWLAGADIGHWDGKAWSRVQP